MQSASAEEHVSEEYLHEPRPVRGHPYQVTIRGNAESGVVLG